MNHFISTSRHLRPPTHRSLRSSCHLQYPISPGTVRGKKTLVKGQRPVKKPGWKYGPKHGSMDAPRHNSLRDESVNRITEPDKTDLDFGINQSIRRVKATEYKEDENTQREMTWREYLSKSAVNDKYLEDLVPNSQRDRYLRYLARFPERADEILDSPIDFSRKPGPYLAILKREARELSEQRSAQGSRTRGRRNQGSNEKTLEDPKEWAERKRRIMDELLTDGLTRKDWKDVRRVQPESMGNEEEGLIRDARRANYSPFDTQPVLPIRRVASSNSAELAHTVSTPFTEVTRAASKQPTTPQDADNNLQNLNEEAYRRRMAWREKAFELNARPSVVVRRINL